MGTCDAVVSTEQWFVYGAETKEAIDKYCSSIRYVQLLVLHFQLSLSCQYVKRDRTVMQLSKTHCSVLFIKVITCLGLQEKKVKEWNCVPNCSP